MDVLLPSTVYNPICDVGGMFVTQYDTGDDIDIWNKKISKQI